MARHLSGLPSVEGVFFAGYPLGRLVPSGVYSTTAAGGVLVQGETTGPGRGLCWGGLLHPGRGLAGTLAVLLDFRPNS